MPFALAIAPCLLSAVTAHADVDREEPPATVSAAAPAEKPIYLASGVGVTKVSGAAGLGVSAELGIGVGSLPVGLHFEVIDAGVTTSFLFGANGKAQAARGGLELHKCGGHACAYVGVDVGEASVHTMSNGGFLSDEGFSRSGLVVVPRAAFEIGRSILRFRATMEASLGDVPGANGTLGIAAHF